MAKIRYEAWAPKGETLDVIAQAEQIASSYLRQGYDLTLRQLYYQFVSRGLIPNTQQSYNRLGHIINKGRMAGLLDWNYIVDRTRSSAALGHWDSPSDIIDSAASGYHIDLWADQPTRVEVWVEKEALAGVVGQVADRWDCRHFPCRGYVSQSELWRAAQRIRRLIQGGQNVVVLHLGDHDPSGIDMSRDITDRLTTFICNDYRRDNPDCGSSYSSIQTAMREHCGGRGWLEVRRIALNMDQVLQYNPPPNPAKMTDSRVGNYLLDYGDESWELDALEPSVLDALIEGEIQAELDEDAYELRGQVKARGRAQLDAVSARWTEIEEFLEETA